MGSTECADALVLVGPGSVEFVGRDVANCGSTGIEAGRGQEDGPAGSFGIGRVSTGVNSGTVARSVTFGSRVVGELVEALDDP